MRTLSYLLLAASLLLATGCAHGPIGFWSRNRVDRQGERQGPWRSYHDAQEQHVATKSRFRHGRQVGRISYYDAQGELLEREWAQRRSAGLVRVRYYHPNGETWRQGQARYVNEPDGLHFYWFGDWGLYDTAGHLVKMETYEVGRLVRTIVLSDQHQ